MFANRFTAFVDANVLAGALKRNLLLTLAEAGHFRVRWSAIVLGETERAIEAILEDRGEGDARTRAAKHRAAMERAFEDANVADYSEFLHLGDHLPDPNDGHVLAAALKAKADVIVTDNLKHFPTEVLSPLGLNALSADVFIANTVALETASAIPALRKMRERFQKPEMDAEQLLIRMEAIGLLETTSCLKPFIGSL
ncbi:PIN domain-containing protein [Pleomorphomonas diazotrophica]|uniref:PIN domain-containing protein n=1 Tax=Pleomorphomonas diazotrophica TaxID=1166257 RepID=A0A1I4V494_9HYPH|nr:PIN domain-containing protein [Pleomorphomonas diazotrophica]PKR87436.1 PIN domain-containing protein [Pleomorphomonas diazotrophica]SFM96047.1 PIN domain-containing protein [Pleomorphomonas diazotrophica]